MIRMGDAEGESSWSFGVAGWEFSFQVGGSFGVQDLELDNWNLAPSVVGRDARPDPQEGVGRAACSSYSSTQFGA